MSKQDKNTTIVQVPEPPPGPLKRFDLFTIGLGSVIGTGVITYIGRAMALTGHSVWLAYGAGVIWAAFMIAPYYFLNATLRVGGGEYSVVGALLNEKFAGIQTIAAISKVLTVGMYGISFAVYAASLIPSLPQTPTALIFVGLFLVLNLMGIKSSSKAQNIMFIFLMIGLTLFIVFGLFNISQPVFEVSSPEFFKNGFWKGFFPAMVLLGNSSYAYTQMTNYSRQAQNATRDIPKAMFMCIPVLLVMYVGCAIVAAGVLPMDQVAGQPLTLTAKTVLPNILFVFWIIACPLMAISTSLNGIMPGLTNVIRQAAENGWWPKVLTKTNKRGVPALLMTIVCIIGCLPIFLGYSPAMVITNISLFTSLTNLIFIFAVLRLPKKFPSAWAKSSLHMPNGCFYAIMTVSIIVNLLVFYNATQQLSLTTVIISLSLLVATIIYAVLRANSGGIKLALTVWEPNDDPKMDENVVES